MAERSFITGGELGAAPVGATPSRPRRGLAQALPAIAPLRLALALILIFAAFCLLPRTREDSRLLSSFEGAATGLLVFFAVLARQVARSGRVLSYEIVPRRAHYVQLLMHTGIYVYWGWYWRQVYHDAALIVAQIAFLYALDCLICWSRRDQWVLGFGPFPIVLSLNLFLRFHDQWFYWQFAMLAVGVLAKEFLKWKREGRPVHIFNPSSLPLFLFSIVLLATSTTSMTWGIEIAHTFDLPPHMYLEIFLLGLVVQSLFQVTLVTLWSAAALFGLNLACRHFTGSYLFAGSSIPVPVFLSLHLLITDPATSPRSRLGKIIFGTLYGAGVFVSYAALGAFGAPEFYDKLLCVPLLNLTVRWLDRGSAAVTTTLASLEKLSRRSIFSWLSPSAAIWAPRRANFAFMGAWSVLFLTMSATSFFAVPFQPDWQDAHYVRGDRVLMQIAPCIERGAFLHCFFRLTTADSRSLALDATSGARIIDERDQVHSAEAVQLGDSTYPRHADAIFETHEPVGGSLVFRDIDIDYIPALEIILRDEDTNRQVPLEMRDVAIQLPDASRNPSAVPTE